MSLELGNRSSIITSLFVRIDVPDYEVLRFSGYNYPVTINSEQYLPLGQLLSVSTSTSELRPAGQELSIGIAGIPNSEITDILALKFKGSEVNVYRMIFDSVTAQPLAIPGNPAGRFQGIVNNFAIQEEYDFAGQSATNSIIITCSSIVDVLTNKVTGRATNPADQKRFFSNDTSMDRVLSLSRSNLNWGAPA
jgi:hypothetical protein